MTLDIYYFTGTGNSLYVARELSQRIPDSNLVSIPSIMNEIKNTHSDIRKGKKLIKTSSRSVGFVFPCHGIVIPVIVKNFLELLDISSSNYLFGFVTRGGSIFRGFDVINKIFGKYGKQLNASFVINMAMNDPKLKAFSCPTEEELKDIEEKVNHKIAEVYEILLKNEEHHDDISGVSFTRYNWINKLLERLIPYLMFKFADGVVDYFYSDSKCTGCGICEKICPSNKIIIENDEPHWQNEVKCYLCYGCLNFCPNQAIQISDKIYMKSYTKEKGRYPHPYATIKDMINQKSTKGIKKYLKIEN